MGKRQFRESSLEGAGYPTRDELKRSRRLLAGLGALLGAAGIAGCEPVVTQGEPVMPEIDGGAIDAGVVDPGSADAGVPDAMVLAGEPELPDGGAK